MSFYRQHSLVIGLFALACVVVLLVSSPDIMFPKGVSFIDTELTRSSGMEAFVRTKMDLGDKEHMKAFPTEIGDWKGYDYETSWIEESLGADVILMRQYDHPELYQPIYFLTMQSKTASSFHPPPVCYSGIGYELEEEGTEELVVSDTSWTEDQGAYSNISIPFNKLVVFKQSDGEIEERRVVLYCYVKANRFISDTITMIRVSAQAPLSGSYEKLLEVMKDFTAQAIPYLFEFRQEEKGQMIAAVLVDYGIGGYFAIALLISVPLAIMIYPRIRGASGSETETEDKK